MRRLAGGATRAAAVAALLALAAAAPSPSAQAQDSAAGGSAAPAPPAPPRPPQAPPAAGGKAPATAGQATGTASPAAPGQGAPAGENMLGIPGQENGMPVTVEADQGIEWQQEKQLYIARGNAKAVRGDVTVYGQVLTAYYRKTPSGGSDIWRLDADDQVKITTSSDTAFGDKAVYDVDNGVFVLTGKKLELDTPKGVVTARDSLEYWKLKQYAVARGDAKAVREDRTVTADVLEAHFKPDEKGQLVMSFIEAFNNVVVSTATSTARALYGNYDLDRDVADLKGSVKITRGQDQLDGECAVMNMKTGISRLYACAKDDRVRGLLVPKQGETPGGAQPAKPGDAPAKK